MKRTKHISILFIYLLLAACTGTRHLPKGEKLYTGAEIKWVSENPVNTKVIENQAEQAIRPTPNTVYLGNRVKLWLYNLPGEAPKRKLGKWFKKIGEPPVLMSGVKPGVTAALIDAKLFNAGIFKSETEWEIIEKKRTAHVVYTSQIHEPYRIKDLTYAISDDQINRIIMTGKDKTLIKPGHPYHLDDLQNERIRIDAILKNNGYFYFSPDYLLFKADTAGARNEITFRLTLKNNIPPNALIAYHINNVYVDQNYSLNAERERIRRDTVMVNDITFIGREARMAIKPKILSKSIYLQKDELFSRQNHTITLNRLMSMGNFKLVQINFSEPKDSLPGRLDVNILMTPMSQRTFRAEVDLVTKSNNYTGPRINLSMANRNAFSGAELLNVNLAGSFEAQLSGKYKNLYSYSFDPQLEITFPRFITPFNLHQSNSIYVHNTHFLISYNYLSRVNYFDMSTFQFTYGFKWKENIRKEHEFNPVEISSTQISNQSTLFTDLLEANPFLKKSYDEQFIAGGNYSFTYNEQMLTAKKIQYYFHLNSELAGTTFSLAKSIAGDKVSSTNPAEVFGSIYSQFARLSVDWRAYYNFKNKDKLVFRLFAGVGKPWGNSSILPYTKQFFSGGPNSLRAFQINTVGPGTFYQKENNIGFLQMGGDVKLEANGEYRFGIYNFIKGALFVDAGNVWLLKSNPANTGSPFMLSGFIDQLAVGAGLGLRVDVSFFILRFDLGIPLRKPWLEENHRWVINQFDLGSPEWRRDNLILNVAIGYPF